MNITKLEMDLYSRNLTRVEIARLTGSTSAQVQIKTLERLGVSYVERRHSTAHWPQFEVWAPEVIKVLGGSFWFGILDDNVDGFVNKCKPIK